MQKITKKINKTMVICHLVFFFKIDGIQENHKMFLEEV